MAFVYLEVSGDTYSNTYIESCKKYVLKIKLIAILIWRIKETILYNSRKKNPVYTPTHTHTHTPPPIREFKTAENSLLCVNMCCKTDSKCVSKYRESNLGLLCM